MSSSQTQSLQELSNEERLNVYNLFIEGCQHLWSKNKLQEQKIQNVFNVLIPLTQSDPYFLAHLVSYVIRKSTIKDLHVLSTYVNSLSSANGEPFSPGSKYARPNLRYVSWAAAQGMDPKLVKRLVELGRYKYSVAANLNLGQHFPRTFKKALLKYLKYREANLGIVRGVKKSGLSDAYRFIYENLRRVPSDEVASILRWRQKGKEITFEDTMFDFKGKSDLEIAEMIRKNKLPVLSVLGALPGITPVVAVALLEQASGDQAVILRKTFEDAGVLKDPEVLKLYEEKIKTAKNALERVEKFQKDVSDSLSKTLKDSRADVRKEQMGDIGKVYMHIDVSSSMESALEFARDKATLIAECVQNPQENFRWGLFNTAGQELPLPQEFVQDAFKAVLFGIRPNGGTNVAALYGKAREFGADVDVIVSDGGHNNGNLEEIIRIGHQMNPNFTKPRAMVHVYTPGGMHGGENSKTIIKNGYEANNIPSVVLDGSALASSAGVVEAIRMAMKGPMQIIDDIMNEPLLELPPWYYTV